MSRSLLMFYATAQDLVPVLSSLEAQKSLQYTLTGLLKVNKLQTYFSFVDIPNFGQASHPNAIANPTYLVSIRGAALHTSEVPQEIGGVRFNLSQQLNDDTITFSPGGWYGTQVILYGRVATISTSSSSKNLYNLFARALRDHFAKVQEFLVGPEALNLARRGVRLTIGAASPAEVDLKI
jgi:hypothetical protein